MQISILAIIAQKQAKRYDEIKAGSYKLQWKNADNRVAEIERQYERATKVLDAIKNLEVNRVYLQSASNKTHLTYIL